jgi:hypothetical protein
MEGETMVALPLSKEASFYEEAPRACDCGDWVRYAAAGTLAAGAILLLSGQRRAGLVAAASGTALAMIDQQATVRTWWDALPGYIANVQNLLGQAQRMVENISAQRDRLREVIGR